MVIRYENTDISTYAEITACIVRDTAEGRADSAEIELDHAAAWNRWMPRQDDQIQIESDDYKTGILYVNTLLPDNDKYTILATSMPSAAWHQEWETYESTTFADIFHKCAVGCGMTDKLYGTDGALSYGWLLRRNEGRAALADRLCRMEGCMLKAYNGIMRAVNILWAQNLPAISTMKVNSGDPGVSYINQAQKRWASLTVHTPWGDAAAQDTAAEGCGEMTITDLPATDLAQAGRWARGLLLWHNRECEELRIDGMAFSPDITAMVRVDVDGNTQARGQWIVSECEHDLVNLTTDVILRRVIDSIE